MRLTKLEHAAVLIEEDGARLVIDPGSFTRPVEGTADTVAVVLTHEHADHWTPGSCSACATRPRRCGSSARPESPPRPRASTSRRSPTATW